eukprot:1182711-Prorocentrum_minimum.AAC.3
MKAAVKDNTTRGYAAYSEIPRTQWILQWPGMVVLCASQMFWTAEVRIPLRFWRREGDLGRGGLQGARPRAWQLGGPASRGL